MAKVRDQFVTFVHNRRLLYHCHGRRVLVRIPMQAYLVARIPRHGALLREGLEGVPRDEKGGFDVVFVEELEQAAHAYGAGEEATGNVRGGILTAVRTEPACYGVDVD